MEKLTVEELAEAIAKALGSIKIYVLESDITAAQQTAKVVVEQTELK